MIKKIKLLLLALSSSFMAIAQNVDVTATAGTASGSYSNLKGAFDAINAGTHQGAITIAIVGNTTETATAALNASGSGSASYTGVSIYPTQSTLRIAISSSSATLIRLDGASNITFDGRVNQTGTAVDLEIVNTSTSANANIFEFINGASNNIIEYCLVRGRGFGTKSMFNFGTTSSSNGNNNNIIRNNKLTHNGGDNRYDFFIYSAGSSTALNNNNQIKNNEFYNTIQRSVSLMAPINIASNSSEWTIEGNSFYETTAISFGISTSILNLIRIEATNGSGFIIRNNFIGGREKECGGDRMTLSQVTVLNAFEAISLNVGNASASLVENNTIQNIQWRTDNSTGQGEAGSFVGIRVKGGRVDIGGVGKGNTIGSLTTNESIRLFNNMPTAPSSFMIHVASSDSVSVSYNNIGGIYTNQDKNNNFKGYSIYGIYKTNSSGQMAILNNIIGSNTLAHSIEAAYNGTNDAGNAQQVVGIECLGSGRNYIQNNTIRNLTNKGAIASVSSTNYQFTQGIRIRYGSFKVLNNIISDLSASNNHTQSVAATYNQPLSGITVLDVCTSIEIVGNEIYNLVHTTSNFEGRINGIHTLGNSSGNFVCSANYVHDLTSNSPNTFIMGIHHRALRFRIMNNVIVLGDNQNCRVYGILDSETSTSRPLDVLNNTVFLKGAPTTSDRISACFYTTSTSSNNRRFQNNILYNGRENNGATGKHYSIYFQGTDITNLTLNHNNYFSKSGDIGFFNSADISSLPIISSFDANSVSRDPLFVSETVTSPDVLVIKAPLIGATLADVTTNFYNQKRYASTMGALPYIHVWTGKSNESLSEVSNWSSSVPSSTDTVLFSAEAERDASLSANVSYAKLILLGGNKKIKLYSFDLNLEKVEGSNSTNFIQTNGSGVLKTTIPNNASFVFPVGNAAYNPVTLTNKNSASDMFSVKVRDEVLGRGVSGTQVTTPHVNVTWDISKGNTNSGGVDFVFQWNDNQERNSINSFRLNHYDGSTWEFANGSSQSVSGTTTKTMAHTNYAGSFSPFAIGETNTLLPVTLLEFTARAQGKVAVLEWTTANEVNSAYFVVERSQDAQNWEALGSVAAAGTSYEKRTYAFTDKQPFEVNYYRLRQVDWDGSADISSVRTVLFQGFSADIAPRLVVYPNPASSDIHIRLNAVNASFILYDAVGKEIDRGEFSQSFLLNKPAAGVYLLKVRAGEFVAYEKLIVE